MRALAIVSGLITLSIALAASAGEVGANAASPPPPASKASSATAASLADAWTRLGKTTNDCGEKELHFDYWPDGGVRNFFCHARSAIAWSTFLKLAPVDPWLRGPHGKWREGKLALDDPHDFGRYNPKFVRWLVDNAVPAATDAKLREQTQPLYEKYVAQLARTYFAVYEKMAANPAWKKKERALYLKTADEKNPDWSGFYDKYSSFMGKNGLKPRKAGEYDADWGGFDPNLQSASVAFWLRRDVDGTAPIFFEGLQKLLKTYDEKWLASQSQ